MPGEQKSPFPPTEDSGLVAGTETGMPIKHEGALREQQ